VTQGLLSVADVSAQIAATDVDGATDAIRFSLVENTDLFSINATTGVISLTAKGAEAISGLSGSGTTAGAHTLHVQATDANSGVSTSETVTVNVNMAVQAGGTSAILTGSMSNWSIAGSAGTSGGYVLTNLEDPLVKVSLPGTVTQLNFTSGDSVALSNNGTIGNISYSPGSATGTHTIVIANSLENSLITLGTATSATVEGVAGSAKTEGIQIHQNVDVNNLGSVFDAISANHLTMHTTSGTVVMQNVEYVHFDNANVLIVGAGGYSSLATASAAAKSGDVIYVADSTLADGAVNGVINTPLVAGKHADISIYIANDNGANINMSLADANQTVRIYGNHAFNLTGTAGADTVHDYTNLASGKTNYIYGMDGNDNLVSHSADLGTHVMSGGAGADVLIGGTGAQLLGGDGNDKLLAFGGAAILSGGAGDDILLNAYGHASGTVAVNMTGGSGSDTFALIGSDNAAQSGTMKTVVTDLGTGDKIDLSFIEYQKAGVDTSIDTAAQFTAASTSNKASMTTAGTTLTFDSSMNASSSESDAGDTNTQLHAGSLVLSNATLTKVSAAITAGQDTLTTSVTDFHTTFTPLTDTYNHHG
jgi:Ca2+-binding RTX toxin-like protein